MIKNYSIVIADDDEDDHFFLREAIARHNDAHEVTSVYNGQQLCDHLLQLQKQGAPAPDFVILDLNMPLVDGFQCLTRIRSQSELRDLPVYVLSTSRDDSSIEKAKRLGATEYFPKPTDMRSLHVIIGDILSMHTV